MFLSIEIHRLPFIVIVVISRTRNNNVITAEFNMRFNKSRTYIIEHS